MNQCPENFQNNAIETNIWKTYSGEDINYLNKRFLLAYNEAPDCIRLRIRLNLNKAQQAIMHAFNVPVTAFSHFRSYKLTGDKKIKKYNNSFFCHIKNKLMLNVFADDVEIAYSKTTNIREVVRLKQLLQQCISPEKESSRKFFMVKQDAFSGLELEEFDVHFRTISIEENYNDDLLNIHPKIVSYLNNSKTNGLILLHGIPGTGKTSYLRHLISCCSTRFIYIPNNLFHHLIDPSFFSFISTQPNSVIILEDCEELLRSRNENSSSGISNLLNLSDGLLGDALRIKIVCTFNMDLKNIDNALLRKGRLFQRYEFGPLAVEKVNQLLKNLNSEVVSIKPMSLSEIYNYAETNGSEESQLSKKKIGFS